MNWSNDLPSDVARLCDFLAGLSSAEGADLQKILEELNMYERLSLTLVMLNWQKRSKEKFRRTSENTS